jgi:preprotein translocase subunit SecA
MFNFLSKLFPSKHEKDVRELVPYIDQINAFDDEFQKLSDEELIQKTQQYKDKIKTETQELENKIAELNDKLKTDITHTERQDIYAELNDLDKELQDLTESILLEILSKTPAEGL